MQLHKYEKAILLSIYASAQKHEAISIESIAKDTGISKDAVMWALESLASKGLVKIEKKMHEEARLSEEGMHYATTALPEEKLLTKLREERGGSIQAKELKSEEERIGLQWAKAKGLVSITNGNVVLTELGKNTKEIDTGTVLRQLSNNEKSYEELKIDKANEIKELANRHLLVLNKRQQIEKIELSDEGRKLAEESSIKPASEEIGELTKEMIKNKTWKNKVFSQYNIEAEPEPAPSARLHILRRTINDIRKAYLSMGFQEISGPIVEPAFWVFDYLFVPQDHPAREAQDTFFVETPSEIKVKEGMLVKRVKKEHEKSWHTEWNEKVALQTVLRTHTTSVTGRQIYNITSILSKRKNALELPLKFFTIGRVFRNENLDYKHLADFYQTDGIIMGYNLTLSNLFDTLLKIYKTINIDIKFKPSYFPFVEPGVEVDIKYGDTWLEMGGAGIIRREIVGNRDKRLKVLAWGLGVERIALIKSKNISSIVSLYNPSIGWLRENSI